MTTFRAVSDTQRKNPSRRSTSNVLAVENYFSASEGQKTRNSSQCRRFASPIGANQRNELATPDCERDSLNCRHLAIAADNIVELKHASFPDQDKHGSLRDCSESPSAIPRR